MPNKSVHEFMYLRKHNPDKTIPMRNGIASILWPINNRYSNIVTFKVLISIIFLSIGGLIYLGWRSGNLVMFQLLEKWGMSDHLTSIRNIGTSYSLFEWVKYSLPDGLWLFSYMFLIDAIWHNEKKHILYYVFLWSLPIIAIASEILQYVEIVPGTFDIVDLLCYMMAIIIFTILDSI